jgi:hypothetical protein
VVKEIFIKEIQASSAMQGSGGGMGNKSGQAGSLYGDNNSAFGLTAGGG